MILGVILILVFALVPAIGFYYGAQRYIGRP